MKSKLKGLVFIAAILVAPSTWATQFLATGTVSFLRIFDASYGYNVVNWIAVSGFTSAGSCATVGGRLPLMMKDDVRGQQMLQLAQSARIANIAVTVSVDDTYKISNGYCLIQHISIAD
ncbi:MAG: hypothetical protein J0I77_06075 [Rudaea sp.]|uniref:hypothetical protein n=1 Tax=unclassified Rudaea TaxID=2627037 RepID=UPI0010F68394|nr:MULTISPECIES: hypothetical protein [unclassified Rudaea]MBN8885267.1 hypothetical protein [Rudaea sp.]